MFRGGKKKKPHTHWNIHSFISLKTHWPEITNSLIFINLFLFTNINAKSCSRLFQPWEFCSTTCRKFLITSMLVIVLEFILRKFHERKKKSDVWTSGKLTIWNFSSKQMKYLNCVWQFTTNLWMTIRLGCVLRIKVHEKLPYNYFFNVVLFYSRM